MTSRWSEYFTPKDLASALVDHLEIRQPRTAIDLCAGQGGLLAAALSRWPDMAVTGNDLYRGQPHDGFAAWYRLDARWCASRLLQSGHQYDVVLGNPPFGRSTPIKLMNMGLDLEVRNKIGSLRFESAITAAGSLLVAPGGVMGTIIPDTLAFGERYEKFRRWLRNVFFRVSIVPLRRRAFRNNDLGLAFLIGYRAKERSSKSKNRFSAVGARSTAKGVQDTSSAGNVVAVKAQRGTLMSSAMSARGSVPVLHCSGGGVKSSTLRRTSLDAGRGHMRVFPGEIVVTRVGRGAGGIGIHAGEEAVLSDCMFVVRGLDVVQNATIRRAIKDGTIQTRLRRKVHGLGATFCTARHVEEIIRLTLRMSTQK